MDSSSLLNANPRRTYMLFPHLIITTIPALLLKLAVLASLSGRIIIIISISVWYITFVSYKSQVFQ